MLRWPKDRRSALLASPVPAKSVTSFAVMRILDRAGHIADGAIDFNGVDIRSASERACVNFAAAKCR